MTDLLHDDDLKTERAVEPAKGWNNWWRFVVPHGFPIGTDFRMGPHPSKDVAQTRAQPELNALFARVDYPDDCVEYLGAYPEGERP